MINNNDLNKKLNKSFEKLRFYQQRKFISDYNLALTPIINDNGKSASKDNLLNNGKFNSKKNYWNDKESFLNLVSTNKLRYVFFK